MVAVVAEWVPYLTYTLGISGILGMSGTSRVVEFRFLVTHNLLKNEFKAIQTHFSMVLRVPRTRISGRISVPPLGSKYS